jgi:hypothetical protein
MKFRVKWTATYETVIEAEDETTARDSAADIDVSVPGSTYIEDSWEVDSLRALPE